MLANHPTLGQEGAFQNPPAVPGPGLPAPAAFTFHAVLPDVRERTVSPLQRLREDIPFCLGVFLPKVGLGPLDAKGLLVELSADAGSFFKIRPDGTRVISIAEKDVGHAEVYFEEIGRFARETLVPLARCLLESRGLRAFLFERTPLGLLPSLKAANEKRVEEVSLLHEAVLSFFARAAVLAMYTEVEHLRGQQDGRAQRGRSEEQRRMAALFADFDPDRCTHMPGCGSAEASLPVLADLQETVKQIKLGLAAALTHGDRRQFAAAMTRAFKLLENVPASLTEEERGSERYEMLEPFVTVRRRLEEFMTTAGKKAGGATVAALKKLTSSLEGLDRWNREHRELAKRIVAANAREEASRLGHLAANEAWAFEIGDGQPGRAVSGTDGTELHDLYTAPDAEIRSRYFPLCGGKR